MWMLIVTGLKSRATADEAADWVYFKRVFGYFGAWYRAPRVMDVRHGLPGCG